MRFGIILQWRGRIDINYVRTHTVAERMDVVLLLLAVLLRNALLLLLEDLQLLGSLFFCGQRRGGRCRRGTKVGGPRMLVSGRSKHGNKKREMKKKMKILEDGYYLTAASVQQNHGTLSKSSWCQGEFSVCHEKQGLEITGRKRKMVSD